MNEEQKNIETCLAENILSEVASVPTDPQFRSLVEESFDPLQQQALKHAGYDGYEKVVWTHKPYTFTSQVKQMKSNLILLLRRLWRFPFGRGTIRSLDDMWQHYITRLNGNPEYGIPSRLSSLTDLPASPLLVADRKINGVDVPDGISIANLIGSGYTDIEEVNDTNHGWSWVNCHDGVMNQSRGVEQFFTKFFPSLKKITLNCKSIVGKGGDVYLLSSTSLEEIYFAELETYTNTWYSTFFNGCTNLLVLEMPNFASFYEKRDIGGYIGVGCNKLRRAVFGNMAGINKRDTIVMKSESPDLIHLEFGHNGIAVAESMNLSVWSPTNAIDASRTDLIEEGSTAQNNLQQFLQNFRDYIALRLTDQGTGLTLTLSQEVRNAIHAAEYEYGIENIIITQKGWTISPAPN